MRGYFKQLLKEVRLLYMSEKVFVGRYVEVEIARRQWAKKNPVIILGEKRIPTGVRKVHQQMVFYVTDNAISKMLGFKKQRIHYTLAGWH
jgi:hypothetical protein